MISLLIDTSSVNLLVSIVKNHEILSFSKIENIVGLSTKLLAEIDCQLEKEKLSISDVDTIFIVNGPGSFTGLRVGVTVAKTIAYSLHKKIIPISSLELLATTTFDGDYIIPYIDARRECVYAGIYDHDLNVYKKDSYISVVDLVQSIPVDKNFFFVGYTDIDGIANRLTPKEDVLMLIKKHENDEGINPHLVNPNYLKRTEAEENLNG